jgi:hypothetical protein
VTVASGAPPDNSDEHLIESDSFAAALDADEYILAGYANNATSALDGGAERHQIYRGEFNLTENLAGGAAAGDQTTHAERMVGLLQAKLERLEAHDLTESDVQRSRLVIEERNKTLDRLKYYLEFRNYELKRIAERNTGQNQSVIAPRWAGGW